MRVPAFSTETKEILIHVRMTMVALQSIWMIFIGSNEFLGARVPFQVRAGGRSHQRGRSVQPGTRSELHLQKKGREGLEEMRGFVHVQATRRMPPSGIHIFLMVGACMSG